MGAGHRAALPTYPVSVSVELDAGADVGASGFDAASGHRAALPTYPVPVSGVLDVRTFLLRMAESIGDERAFLKVGFALDFPPAHG